MDNNEEKFLKEHFQHEQEKMAYREHLEKEKKELYDVKFVDFYREGKIKVNDKEYNVEDLYLERGISNGEESLFLVYYRFPDKDILTNKAKIDFRRTGLMDFKSAYIFYRMYKKYEDTIEDNTLYIDEQNIKPICDLVQSFDGSIHVETPETAYKKVKPRSESSNI